MSETATTSPWRFSGMLGIGLAAGILLAITAPLFKAKPLPPITEDQVIWNTWTENFKPDILAQLNALQAEKTECRGTMDLADIADVDDSSNRAGEKVFFVYCFRDAQHTAFSRYIFPLHGPATLQKRFP